MTRAAELEAQGLSLIATLAFFIADLDDWDKISNVCLRIRWGARRSLDLALPEMPADERDSLSVRFVDQIQIEAVRLQSRCTSVRSAAIH